MSRQAYVSSTGRRIDLDWLRIAAFGLLIFYHVGMKYVPWQLLATSRFPVTEIEPLMVLCSR